MKKAAQRVYSGKTLLLVEILKIYMSFFKLNNSKTKVLVLVYHEDVDDCGELINDFRSKYLHGDNINVMTFKQACKGK